MRLVLAFMWLLHWLPLPILGRFGEAVGALLFTLLRARRRIALINLGLCLPHLSEAEREKLARRHFQAYARSILERGVLWWASRERLSRLIEIESEMPLSVLTEGPTIMLCPHFVCLDVAGVAIVLKLKIPSCSMYTRQQNKVFDEALYKGRSRFLPVKLFSRADGIKPVIRAMREGLPFFMLPDMDFGRKDAEFVPFFGIPAATLTAPARLAGATGAKVVVVIATYKPNYRGWTVRFYKPWEDYPGKDVTAATRRMNEVIEQRVLEAPDEYFWAHKRFKTRPEGETGFYGKKPHGG